MPPTITPFGYISLSESVNKIITPNTFVRDTLFSKRTITHATKVIQVDVVIGGRKLLPFVKRGDPAKVMEHVGKSTQLVEPPSIRAKKFFTPDDLLFNRASGQSVYVIGGTGDNAIQSARMEKIGLEQKEIKMRQDRTEEFMSCQSIANGKFTYQASDLEFEIDFLTPGANLPVLNGGNKWSAKGTCTPIDDVAAWKKLIKKACGLIPTRAIMTSDIWTLFQASQQVQDYLNKWNIKIGEINTEANIILMGAEKKARIDNVDYYVYDEYYDSGAGILSMIPVTNFILVSDAADYRLNYGAIEDLEAGSVIGKYFSKDWLEKDPSGLNMLVESHPLPTIHQPDSIVSAKVI
jgi:hypothetical protein